MKPIRIAIVGAGPAGLTAAVAAKEFGLQTTVFEQALGFARVGGGLLLHSNGLRVLEKLNLLKAFLPRLSFSQKIAIELPDGKCLSVFDYRKLSIPHNSAAVALRYDLQEHLLGAALRNGTKILFGHKCTMVLRERNRVILRFANEDEREFDIVIACDGIHSPVRAGLGLRVHQRKIGEGYLRGVANRSASEATIREIWGADGRRFGICPLPGTRTYFYCSVSLGGWHSIMQRGLSGWIESWATYGFDVLSILRSVQDWQQVIYDELQEVTVSQWYQSPIFLVGDAAHAMTPNLGQGANCAMVDSLILMQLLASAMAADGDLAQVGRVYESLRRPFVTAIQNASRRLGILARWSFAPARGLRDAWLHLSQKSEGLQNWALRLGAGYNPKEERYFHP